MKLLTLHHTDNGNCRIYFKDNAKRLVCFQPAHLKGQFSLLACSRDGEPSHNIEFSGYIIDRMPGASDGATAVQFRTWYLASASDSQRIFVMFYPEVWIQDNATLADPGETQIDVTAEILDMGMLTALKLKDNDYPSDDLRLGVETPQWVKDWPGPHRVSCECAFREHFTEDTQVNAS
ncbi:hypothetical protein LCG56_28555 (plasmid) [Pseudomonas cannabina pv. alisalensis]|uniref:Uncharacterized protein n=1 Tax=Pseudomonas syringae pv. maculicola str. ES4326 TaxID=629265 RepID=A0A8T8CAR6_PSEYM|nr:MULTISPECIES: hypothetical protein [Pseudomonas syringae group]QHF00711.1 hypothetical protein PMA4326_029925 [Pseudomonas syringae pv. maculicola str. ES4326]UBZ00321.1 hypothetical protein LCG56_28555 [Pseudomonas cannabina pv. alisalensis]